MAETRPRMTTEHDRLIEHEAAHATAALLHGLRVVRADAPPTGGQVVVDINPHDRGEIRKLLIATLCGGLAERLPDWPPTPPLSAHPRTSDEADVMQYTQALNLDTKTYGETVADARATLTRHDYRQLHALISALLEQCHHLDQRDLELIKAAIVPRKTAPPRRGRLTVVAKVRPLTAPPTPLQLPRWTRPAASDPLATRLAQAWR